MVAAQNLDQLLPNICEGLLGDRPLVRVKTSQVVALSLHCFVLILPIPLQEKSQTVFIDFVTQVHRVKQKVLKLIKLTGAISLPIHESDHILKFIEHTIFKKECMQVL